MDKKSIVLIVILVAVLIFYFQIMEFLGFYHPPEPQPTVEKQVVVDTISQPVKDTQYQIESDLSATSASPAGLKLPVIPVAEDSLSSDTIVVTTNKYVITLSSLGGGPVSMLLKEYSYRDGNLIEMIPNASYVTPEATFAAGSFSTSQIKFTSYREPGNYDATREAFDVIYIFKQPGGGEIKKHFRFYPDDYHYDLFFEVNNREMFGFERRYNLVWNTPLGITEPQPSMDYDAMEAVAMQSGSREKLNDFDNGRLNQSLDGYTSWAGVRSKYFAAVLIPKNRDAEGVFAAGEKKDISTTNGKVEQKLITVGINMPFANVSGFTDSFTVFVGPLDYTLLSKYKVGLEDMLGIGTTPVIGWLIKPFAIGIIWLLPKMYSVFPNYGLVIILFALFIKIVTMPLSMKSFKSMNAMKELQPKIDELKKKHKNNPQAMQKEQMKLFKKHGVNPLSGCLVMLPQMPLFFALFSVFRQTILLRNAPFVWFIDDLSRGAVSFTDPYIILVVIMVAAQFVSQKLTMGTSQQNKALLYVMPLFMGFIFYKFAAGLVLYWTCFSVFSLLDYFVFKRKKNVEVKTL